MHEREAVHAVATLYYVQNETMASIAARLNVSRSTVSRMLEQARESGIVDIKVNPVDAGSPFAEMALKSFGIRVALGLGAQKRDDCASARSDGSGGRSPIGRLFRRPDDPGGGLGTTASAVAEYLPSKNTRGSQVVQLNDAASHRSSGVGYAGQVMDAFSTAFDAEATHFTVPAFFDYPETKAAPWRE